MQTSRSPRSETGTLRISAYVLAGDPAWCVESVASYYDHVDRVLVSYDENNRSWSGGELEVPEVLEKLRSMDVAKKLVMFPGDYSRPGEHPLESETLQRQAAIDHLAAISDWVVQLDTDEVMADPGAFFAALTSAEEFGCEALDYPSRWVYQETAEGTFIERSRRFWGARAGYPGAMAVRSGARLSHCRQTEVPTFRVDFAANNTDPARPRSARVDRVVTPGQAIIHMSWVRTLDQMRKKALVSGHSGDPRWADSLRDWERARKHPWLTVATTPFRRDRDRWLRMCRLPGFA